MSTANFWTMKQFPLYVKVYEAPTLEEYHMDWFGDSEEFEEYDDAETDQEKEEILQRSYEKQCEIQYEFYYDDIANDMDGFITKMHDFANELQFFNIDLKSGYYDGIQLYIDAKDFDNPEDMDNDDAHNYYDCCRSEAIRKYNREIKKINKWLHDVAEKQYGWCGLDCVGVFSNGEAIYEWRNK